MVNRHRNGNLDVKPTTINFNTVLDAWAKSGGGRSAAERAEEILEWMDRLHKDGNNDVKPDTITFNAVLDAWARSGDRMAPHRSEQIVDHMDELYRAGNKGVKPDTYTYNTLVSYYSVRAKSPIFVPRLTVLDVCFVDQRLGEIWRERGCVTSRTRAFHYGEAIPRRRRKFQAQHEDAYVSY
jgi:hypothetical protein